MKKMHKEKQILTRILLVHSRENWKNWLSMNISITWKVERGGKGGTKKKSYISQYQTFIMITSAEIGIKRLFTKSEDFYY